MAISRHEPFGVLCLALVLVLLTASAAGALEADDVCVLKAPLAIALVGERASVETDVEAGTGVEVLGVNAADGARVRAQRAPDLGTTARSARQCSVSPARSPSTTAG